MKLVARSADMSNFSEPAVTGGARTLEDVRRKCDALRRYCEEFDRPFGAILKSFTTLCLALAPTAAAATAKGEQIPRQFWSTSFVGTPSEAIAYFQPLVDCGIQYFTPFVYGGDVETVELLAQQAMPQFGRR